MDTSPNVAGKSNATNDPRYLFSLKKWNALLEKEAALPLSLSLTILEAWYLRDKTLPSFHMGRKLPAIFFRRRQRDRVRFERMIGNSARRVSRRTAVATIKYLGNEDWTIIINQTGPATRIVRRISRAPRVLPLLLSREHVSRLPFYFFLRCCCSLAPRYVQKWRTNRTLSDSDTLNFSPGSQGGRREFLLATLWYRCFNYAAWPKLAPKGLMDASDKKRMTSGV